MYNAISKEGIDLGDIFYNIYRDGEKIASNIIDNFFTEDGLSPKTTYNYQISAENKYGESELSNFLLITTLTGELILDIYSIIDLDKSLDESFEYHEEDSIKIFFEEVFGIHINMI